MNSKRFVNQVIFFVLLAFGLSMSAYASEKATKEECIAKAKEAAALIASDGLEVALEKINDPNGDFVWKDTYVFALTLDEGKVIAQPMNPKHIGKVLTGIKDVAGKMFFVEFLNTARDKGEGWVSYMWPKPGEKKPSKKDTYVYRVPGENVLVAAGIYE
jgi:glycerol uptake facilitator-like aquaporin